MVKRQINLQPLQAPTNYWESFLRSQGLLSEFTEIVQNPTVKGEHKALVDPMFKKFLYYASQYGAPANISAFQKLTAKDKIYYLKAYEEWLKNIRKKGIKV